MKYFTNKSPIIVLTIVLFTLACFQGFYRIGEEPIKIWDESSSATNSVEMLMNKKYFIVHKDGVPDHHDVKPPLQLWLKVISYKFFGINEFAVRFPTVISALLIFILIIIFGKINKMPFLAIATLYLIAITNGFNHYHVIRHGDTDTLLMFLITGYFLSFFLLLEKYPKNKNIYFTLFGIFIVFAVFTKSIAGLAPLAGFPFFFLAFKRNWKILKDYRLYISILGIVLAIAAYYITREAFDPGFLKSVYKQHFKVITEYPGTVKHPEFSFYFNYLRTFGFYPFLYWLPISIIPMIFGKNQTAKRLIVYSLICATLFLIGQSSVVMKNEWYIAPIYIFLWIAVATSITESLIILSKIQFNKYLKISIFIISAIGFSYFYVNRFIKIHNKNMEYIKPYAYIYPPERAGNYLDGLKERNPNINNITIVSTYNLRQVKFYTKKYEYLHNSEFSFTRKIEPSMLNMNILTTEKEFKKEIESTFYFTIIDTAKYGILYHTDSIKYKTQN